MKDGSFLKRRKRMSDTISRSKAIDGKICIRRSNGVEIYDDYVVPVEYLEQLPPAEPKRGKWIYKTDLITAPTGYWECSECKEGRLLYEENFCPHCGADMREVTE
jgi:hypothetical protein